MYSAALKERLRDPAYLDLHMMAVAAAREVKPVTWYDAQFLQIYNAARRMLEMARPDAVARFEAAFAPLHAPADFKVKEIEGLFAPDVLEGIRREVRDLPSDAHELHETKRFGRSVVHNHPYFAVLQGQLTPLVSDLAGTELVAGYSFLSLYGNMGRCDPHMDQPISMYTLDFCIDQSLEWPIWFSDVVDWPTREEINTFDEQKLLAEVPFQKYVLKPNNAVFFSGSSQWHYRDAMPAPGFCNLLFFHYYPASCADLIHFHDWSEVLGIPELGPLCDLFAEAFPRSTGQ